MGYKARKSDEAFFFKAFSRIRTTVEDQIAEGDKVVSRVTMEADHTGDYQNILPTGTRTKFTFIDIARVASGAIVEEWAGFDMLSIFSNSGPSDAGTHMYVKIVLIRRCRDNRPKIRQKQC